MGTKKIKKNEKRTVRDVPAENYFYVCNGKVLRNLAEFREEMNTIDEGAFRYHVNDQKNDFANWIKDVMKETRLANELRKCSTIQEVKQKMDKTLAVLS